MKYIKYLLFATLLTPAIILGYRFTKDNYIKSQTSDKVVRYLDKHGDRLDGDGYRETNCSQFVYKTVKELTGAAFSKDEKKIMFQAYPPNTMQKLIESHDPRSTGWQMVLVNRGLGKKVSYQNISPGDIVQWWEPRPAWADAAIYTATKTGLIQNFKYKSFDYIGHSAIVRNVNSNGTFDLYGAQPWTLGFGTIYRYEFPESTTYAVRLYQ